MKNKPKRTKPKKRKVLKGVVDFLGEAGKLTDAIMLKGRKYFFKDAHLRERAAVRRGMELLREGYDVRLVRGLGIWRVYVAKEAVTPSYTPRLEIVQKTQTRTNPHGRQPIGLGRKSPRITPKTPSLRR